MDEVDPKEHKPFGRPSDVVPSELETARTKGEEQLRGLPGMPDYLADSKIMPEWKSECGNVLPCAQGECPVCGESRPFEWRDEEQEDGKQGEWRKLARGKLNNPDGLFDLLDDDTDVVPTSTLTHDPLTDIEENY